MITKSIYMCVYMSTGYVAKNKGWIFALHNWYNPIKTRGAYPECQTGPATKEQKDSLEAFGRWTGEECVRCKWSLAWTLQTPLSVCDGYTIDTKHNP